MSPRLPLLLSFVIVGATGCLLDRSGLGGEGPHDAGDAAPSEAGVGDSGLLDGGPFDAGPFDAGPADAGPMDAEPFDAEPFDAGPVDGGPSDACVPTAELCNGLDDDCDPLTADGADEVTLGDPCDSTDDDLCADDTVSCVGGALVCEDDGSDAEEAELCNGLDDDCNVDTDDGSDEPTLGTACDSGSDDDLCTDDTVLCLAGALSCVDDLSDVEEEELCNGLDDDCDGSLDDDGADDPALGAACDGPDADMCLGGTLTCVAGAPACDDSPGDAVEDGCNGGDEDCDGTIDEGTNCGCDRVMFSGHAYLFCDGSGDRRDWTDARDFCRARSYELVSIESLEEQRFVGDEARSRRSDRSFWIGANDRSSEGNFVWVDSPPRPVSYTNWSPDEPNNFFDEDCAELTPASETSPGLSGGWNDADCGVNRRFICEAGP